MLGYIILISFSLAFCTTSIMVLRIKLQSHLDIIISQYNNAVKQTLTLISKQHVLHSVKIKSKTVQTNTITLISKQHYTQKSKTVLINYRKR